MNTIQNAISSSDPSFFIKGSRTDQAPAPLAESHLPTRPPYASDHLVRHMIKKAWRLHANQKKGTASQHAAYHLLLGHDLSRAFTPLTRQSKIDGYAGGNPNQARDEAKRQAEGGFLSTFEPWAELLTQAPKTTGWRPCYEGGIEALRKVIEDQVEMLSKQEQEQISTPIF